MEAMENRRNSRASVEGQLAKNTSSTPARTEVCNEWSCCKRTPFLQVTAVTASRGTVNSRVALLRNSKHSLLQRVATSSSIQVGNFLKAPAYTLSQVSTATLQRMATQTSLYLNPSANRQGANSIHTSVKMLKTAFVLITVFFVCWLPYNIIMVGGERYLNRKYSKQISQLCEFFNVELPFNLDKHVMDEVSKQLIILNSVINPLLYGFTRKDLRALCQQVRRVLQVRLPLPLLNIHAASCRRQASACAVYAAYVASYSRTTGMRAAKFTEMLRFSTLSPTIRSGHQNNCTYGALVQIVRAEYSCLVTLFQMSTCFSPPVLLEYCCTEYIARGSFYPTGVCTKRLFVQVDGAISCAEECLTMTGNTVVGWLSRTDFSTNMRLKYGCIKVNALYVPICN